jgi:hypothetical protein
LFGAWVLHSQGLQDLVVLFKCPDVHDARPEVEVIDGTAGAAGAGNGTAAAAAAPGSAGSTDSGSSSGLSGWLSRTTSALRRPGFKGIASMLCKALSGNSAGQASPPQQPQLQQQAEQEVALAAADVDSRPISVVCEEWLLQLLDTGGLLHSIMFALASACTCQQLPGFTSILSVA